MDIDDCIKKDITRRKVLKKSGRIALGAGVVACFGCAVAVRSVPNPSIVYNIPSIQQQLTAEEIRKIKGKEPSKRVLTIDDQKAYSLFEKLYQKNPLLAKELGKIPEFQDGVSAEERYALEKIVEIYHKVPDKFDKAFEEMYQTGIPEVRKYCSPLQAMFWLVEDGKNKYLVSVLHKYSLDDLLKIAWGGGNLLFEKSILSDKDVDFIINSVTNESERDRYKKVKKYAGLSKLRNYIIKDYKDTPELFSEKTQDMIKKALDENPNWRWKDFDVVVYRLNDPKLTTYYVSRKFRFQRSTIRGSQGPKNTFEKKGGVCRHYASFVTYCLSKAGYHVKNLTFCWGPGWWQGHTISVLREKKGKYLIVMDSKYPSAITGPYESYNKIAKSCASGAITRMYIENNVELIQRNRNAN